jgi:nucleoid-associated protein YgaU
VEVRKGDTLWRLCAAQLSPGAGAAEIAAAWPAWYRLNQDLIGDDPDLLQPGMRLRVPGEVPRH